MDDKKTDNGVDLVRLSAERVRWHSENYRQIHSGNSAKAMRELEEKIREEIKEDNERRYGQKGTADYYHNIARRYTGTRCK